MLEIYPAIHLCITPLEVTRILSNCSISTELKNNQEVLFRNDNFSRISATILSRLTVVRLNSVMFG